jgi:peptidoglycan/LPS O-acetylase OafA/YrhL
LIRLPPYELLNFWRGIASLGVVAYHWAEIARYRFPNLEGHWLYQGVSWGFLGVQLFFVISGYCIAAAAVAVLRRGETIGDYLFARVRRIYPTYWASLLLVICFILGGAWLVKIGKIGNNIFAAHDMTTAPFLYYLANLTLTMGILKQPAMLAVAWTLCYEVMFYGIVGIALLWGLRSKNPHQLLQLLHLFTVGCLIALWLGVRVFPFDLWAQFGIGVLLFHWLSCGTKEVAQKQVVPWVGAILALMVSFTLFRNVPLGLSKVNSQPQYLATLLVTLGLLLTYRYDSIWSKNPIIRVFAAVGIFSYSLYLTHTLTIRIVSAGAQALHMTEATHYLLFVLAFVVAVGCAYPFFLLFEKPIIESRRVKKTAEKVKPA